VKTFRDVRNQIEIRVDGKIFCSYFELTSLEGSPSYAATTFDCANNELETLKGAPKYVGGDFGCYINELKSFEGAPRYVGGYFDSEHNTDINSLEGLAEYIGEEFTCDEHLIYGENLYIIISSLIRGRYHRHVKEGIDFNEHILKQLKDYFTA
jgi:hypothetical protein